MPVVHYTHSARFPVSKRISQSRPDAVIDGVQFIAFYMTLSTNQYKVLRKIIPEWLWAKKVENSASKARVVAERSEPLFKGEAVEMDFIFEDLANDGWLPTHVHLTSRENGNTRIRLLMEKNPVISQEERTTKKLGDGKIIPKEEFVDLLKLIGRFFWDAMAHHNTATEHLPELIAVNLARPVERDQATNVLSVQLWRQTREISLINDPV